MVVMNTLIKHHYNHPNNQTVTHLTNYLNKTYKQLKHNLHTGTFEIGLCVINLGLFSFSKNNCWTFAFWAKLKAVCFFLFFRSVLAPFSSKTLTIPSVNVKIHIIREKSIKHCWKFYDSLKNCLWLWECNTVMMFYIPSQDSQNQYLSVYPNFRDLQKSIYFCFFFNNLFKSMINVELSVKLTFTPYRFCHWAMTLDLCT